MNFSFVTLSMNGIRRLRNHLVLSLQVKVEHDIKPDFQLGNLDVLLSFENLFLTDFFQLKNE